MTKLEILKQSADAMQAWLAAPENQKPELEFHGLDSSGNFSSHHVWWPTLTPTWQLSAHAYRLVKPKITDGHNPAHLTAAQIPVGRRLMTPEEVERGAQAVDCTKRKDIWVWRPEAEKWEESQRCGSAWEGSCLLLTYCVPVGWKDPLLEKKKLVRKPCGPEHFPPGTVVREIVDFAPNQEWWAIISITASWLRIGSQRESTPFNSQTFMNQHERSIDGGRTWLPCYVEVETETETEE